MNIWRNYQLGDLRNKIEKLIKMGNELHWDNYSPRDTVTDGYGGDPGPSWITWASRIGNLLAQTVNDNSEPHIYFKEAENKTLKGYEKDHFDFAKENYIKSLTTVLKIVDEGDVFDDLLIPHNSSNSIEEVAVESVSTTEEPNQKKVFIVHGHDHNLKIELEVFLSHIGLKPIVLHREVDAGQTIIEKFENNSNVAFAFILLTPDEISYTSDQEHKPDSERKRETRARPNVIFEFGYFIAKLGRNRVCALHKGDVNIPSDLNGFIYKKVDTSIEEIGFSLIKELKSAGLKPEL